MTALKTMKREDTGRDNSRERILNAAEGLFREKGLHGASLVDVARAVGIRKPSLYHHFPGGKEELFLAVHKRMFERLGNALGDILSEIAETTEPEENVLEKGLMAAAEWFIARPPIFMLSMMHHDMPGLSSETRTSLVQYSYGVIMRPIVELALESQRRGTLNDIDPHTVAGGFLSVLEGTIVAAQAGLGGELSQMIFEGVKMIVYGATSRDGCGPEHRGDLRT